MASHGKKRHMKRLAKPRSMPISAKKHAYLKKALPGPHPKEYSLPIGTFLVEIAALAANSREARSILRSGAVLVDQRPVRELGFPIGIMDTVSVPAVGKHLLVYISKGKLSFKDIPAEAAKAKLCRITGKRQLGASKFQISLHDGRNVLLKDAKKYSTGGTLKISLPKQEVLEYYPLLAGCRCFVYRGVHSGEVATLKGILEREASAANEAALTAPGGEEFITRREYLFVVGPDF